jgi:hypothetical protein
MEQVSDIETFRCMEQHENTNENLAVAYLGTALKKQMAKVVAEPLPADIEAVLGVLAARDQVRPPGHRPS